MRVLLSCLVAGLIVVTGCGPASGPAPPAAAAASGSPAPAAASHLRVRGTGFVDSNGQPFQWRGISAFRLVEMIARGREQDAAAYLDWASSKGLTVVRVFTMAHHLFKLEPGDGVAALPRLLELAAARRLHVEIVALSDTREIPVDLAQHVKAIGGIAARHANALVEIANEPVHPTQRREVHDPEVLRQVARAVPSHVPVSLGSIETGEGFAAGSYVTWHVPREYEPNGWGHVLAIAAGGGFVTKWNKPVVSDEPIGAAAASIRGRRDNASERFRAAALLTRLAGLGATFHYESGLQAQIPEDYELQCFDAWNQAWWLLPADVELRGTFSRDADQRSAVAAFDPKAAAAVFERRTERDAWVLAVGVTDEPRVRVATGWRVAATARFPGIRLDTLTRN